MRLAFVVLALLVAAPAGAYPQFQLTSATDRCIACHLSPAGGGLLNDYGRDEAGDTISRGGDGRFLHGAWTPPSWIAIGGDFRGAAGVKLRDPETEGLLFPMQAELYTRVQAHGLSLYLAAGLRGSAREPSPPLVERLASREHYVMYERDDWYVRAGRFFPIYGLRSQDHTAYVRRYLGFHTLEEPYGLAGGYFASSWEAHVSAFVPRPVDVLGAGVPAKGLAASYERRILDDTAAFALQTRTAVAGTTRVALGAIGKRWFRQADVLLLGELDLQRESGDGVPAHYQLAGYLGASTTLARGVLGGVAVQRWQPDVALPTARDAVELNLQYFPRAHLELHLLVRATGQGDYDRPGLLSFLQVHYYL